MVIIEACAPLLGFKTVQQMKLVEVHYENIAWVEKETEARGLTVDQISAQFHDVFNGEGRLEKKLQDRCDDRTSQAAYEKNTRGHEAKTKRRISLSTKNQSYQTSQHANRLGVESSGSQEIEQQVENVYWLKAAQQSIKA